MIDWILKLCSVKTGVQNDENLQDVHSELELSRDIFTFEDWSTDKENLKKVRLIET